MAIRHSRQTLAVAVLCVLLSACSGPSEKAQPSAAATTSAADQSGVINAYANNNGDTLPPDYKGPRYRLSHNYPTSVHDQPVDPPWRKALGGKPIANENAVAYAQALKDYIAGDIRVLVNEYEKWDPVAAGWYDQPWIGPKIGKWPGREPIQGAYPGPGFDKATYPDLKVDVMQDYVIVYYNDVAAYTLHQVWQKPNPYNPQPENSQFAEGSIVIKLAVTNVSGKDWAPMQGAASSNVFVPPPTSESPTPVGVAPQLLPVYVMQMDIVVKDTKTAPKTGWVFTTLVYDKDARGATTWDRMVPLGTAWGNDPGVSDDKLKETVINPVAPAYSKITLGWGLRLSGPNDAAASGDGKGNYTRISSCMSCHGTAEYPADVSLVPVAFKPNTPEWNQWFQDRDGRTAQTNDGKHTGLDYDMVTRQALVNWDAARGSDEAKARADRHFQMLRARGHSRGN